MYGAIVGILALPIFVLYKSIAVRVLFGGVMYYLLDGMIVTLYNSAIINVLGSLTKTYLHF